MSVNTPVTAATSMQKNFLLASILSLGAMVTSMPTFAEAPRDHRIVNLQAETSRDVQNDEMQATLYTELNNTNPTTLARDTAVIVNKALDLAKAYPAVKVSSGTQSTYPIYSDKNKLTGWRGRAEIQIKTSDFKAGSELIAQLQSNMQLEAVNFSVSAQQRLKVENELLTDITKIFRERATLLQNAWGAGKYELVEMNITSSNDEPRPYPRMMSMAKAAASDSVPAQAVESGNSKVRVQANGSIQLQ